LEFAFCLQKCASERQKRLKFWFLSRGINALRWSDPEAAAYIYHAMNRDLMAIAPGFN